MLTGKTTSFLGPLIFGIITNFYSQEISIMGCYYIFFLIGLFLFNRIDFNEE